VEPHLPPVSTAGFWDGLYADGQDGWDLGEPAPALVDWLDAGGRFEPAPARIAVPGAGRGHDARLLARRGYRVTAFDFAEAAVVEARRLAAAEAVELAVEQRDVFALAHDHAGAFDGVWEYTCFCAIDPDRRDEYARVLHAILRPGGLLLACFFPLRDGTGGPPFPVSRGDIERVLAGRFTVLEAGPPPRSVERRRGLEWLVRARKEPSGGSGASDR
jgi:SAM-dependent methyltransferase